MDDRKLLSNLLVSSVFLNASPEASGELRGCAGSLMHALFACVIKGN